MKSRIVFFLCLMPYFYFSQNTRCGLPNTIELGSYDIQHYIPPQYARSGLSVPGDIDTGYLVLSTASLAPINISIRNAVYFNNPSSSNALNQTATISMFSPIVINLSKSPFGNRGYSTRNIISGNSAGNIDSIQGLILQSTHPFYAIIRHKSGSQANYLISKGRLSLGKRFRSGHLYNNTNMTNVKSEHISVMATENNTSISISDLPAGMTFVNGPSFPITLNKYESFSLAALQDVGSNNTLVNQLNGGLITSNKNISVISGSFLAGGEGSGRDIGIDQIIPIDYLGKIYFLIRGAGTINLEVPMVVADFDTTQIYINGSTTPIATINSGQHYMVFNQWGTDSTMIISTSKPAYVYQSNSANNINGNGFMILAPLNLSIENQILVVPQPNQIGTSSFYVVTLSGAILKMNSVVITGAKPFASNPNYVYYTIASGSTNSNIECTAPYFCSNSILSGARGAGCSYTGFPNSFAVRDNIQLEAGTSDTSDYLKNDFVNLYNFIFDTICSYPKRGSIQVLSNGKAVYTPNVNSTGCDTLIYSIRDSANNVYDQNYVIYCLKLNILIDSFQDIQCAGQKNGYIKVMSGGGTPNYFYSIKTTKNYGSLDTFVSSNVFNGLPPDTFIIKVIDALGNTDTVHKIIRFINDTSRKDSFKTICKNQLIIFNGKIINSNGTYKDTLTNQAGCDSFFYLHLTVIDTSFKDSFKTICKNQIINFNGLNLNISGIYKDTLVNSKGCDSFLYLHLIVNDTSRKDSFKSICRNQPINFNNQTLSISGIYKDTFVNYLGCDSILVLNLTVLDTAQTDISISICKNQSFLFNSQTLNTSGVYKDTFLTSLGCDSFVILNLNVRDTSYFRLDRSICQGDSILFNNIIHKSTGIYKYSFINSVGCDSFAYLNLVENALPAADAGSAYTRMLCDGDSVQLGTSPIPGNSYKWLPIAGINNSNIAQPWCKTSSSVVYYLTVTNNLTGCQSLDTVQITAKPSDLVLDYKKRVDLKCANIPTGEIEVKAINGNPGYIYSLSPTNFNNSGIFKNLSAGNYQFSIQDARSCRVIDTISIYEPPKLKLDNVMKKNLRCYKSGDGEIQLTVSGGVGEYKYLWFPTNDTLASIKNLDSGQYSVIIVDSNNCLYRDTFKLTHPKAIVLTDTIIKVNPCYGDSLASIEVKVAGGSGGYLHKWSNGKTTSFIANLIEGTYYLTVTDAALCKDSFPIFVKDIYLSLEFDTILPSVINCDGLGSIYLKAKGGYPTYSYSIDSGKSFYPSNKFRISLAKTYPVQVKDRNNCITKTDVPVRDKELLEIEVYPKDTTVHIGDAVLLDFRYLKGDSSNVESIFWSPSEGLSCSDCRSPIVSAYSPTIYSLEIKYDSICYTKAYSKIQYFLDELFIPNSFAPGSSIIENQYVKIYSNNILKAKLQIFNRLGEKIFETDQAHKIPWDGRYKGDLLEKGLFTYWAEIIYLDGRKVSKSGEITLIR